MQIEVLLTVRQLFEMYASGKYSLKQLATWSDAAGLRTCKDGLSLRASAIDDILNRPGYCTLTHPEIDGPIVSRGLWESTQAVFAQRCCHEVAAKRNGATRQR